MSARQEKETWNRASIALDELHATRADLCTFARHLYTSLGDVAPDSAENAKLTMGFVKLAGHLDVVHEQLALMADDSVLEKAVV